MVSKLGHRFKSLEPHCEGGIVSDFTIRSNTNGFGLRSNAIKDLCPIILHQLVVGWIGKAHNPTSDNCKDRACHMVLGKVLDDPLIRDDHQGGVCRVVPHSLCDR